MLQVFLRHFFCIYLHTFERQFSGKKRKHLENCLNKKFFMRCDLENGFHATLR